MVSPDNTSPTLPVQARDDCFAAASETPMSFDEAQAILRARIGPVVGVERVSLDAALGRILARNLISSRDVPPHDNAAMDGFAVAFDDLTAGQETRLPIGGRAAAGHPLGRAIGRLEAIRIFTGAPLPAGADTVFMEEDCRVEGQTVVLPPGIARGANHRPQGEDVSAGSVVIPAGRRLRAQELGLAASIGVAGLDVRCRLRVAVFSTGDELCEAGTDAPVGAVFDANRHCLIGLLRGLGATVTDLGILPDRRDAIRGALAAAASDHDLLVTSGGMSRGEEDHVRAAVESLGRLHFWQLAIKPGRPIALGQVADKTFIGLPGNPAAVMVTFLTIARPVVLLLSGRSDLDPARFRIPAAFAYAKKTGRREWLRARLVAGADGGLEAVMLARQGAGILTSMTESDGLIDLDEDQGPLAAGTPVDFIPFSEMTA